MTQPIPPSSAAAMAVALGATPANVTMPVVAVTPVINSERIDFNLKPQQQSNKGNRKPDEFSSELEFQLQSPPGFSPSFGFVPFMAQFIAQLQDQAQTEGTDAGMLYDRYFGQDLGQAVLKHDLADTPREALVSYNAPPYLETKEGGELIELPRAPIMHVRVEVDKAAIAVPERYGYAAYGQAASLMQAVLAA